MKDQSSLEARPGASPRPGASRCSRLAFPLALLCLAASSALAQCPRSVVIAPVTAVAGRQTTLPISLVSTGGENGLSFSLSFDPARLSYVGHGAGAGASGASLLVNSNNVLHGTLGVMLAKPAGQSFPGGSNELIRLQFQLSPEVAATPVAFADSPLPREVVDAGANPLCANYSNALVMITALIPPGILADPASQTIQPITNIATNVIFTVSADGSLPLIYQWRWNGTNLTTASQSALVLTNVGSAQTGNYDVVVSNDGGAATSRVAVLSVLPALLPPAITFSPRSQTVSTGEVVYLTVGASGSSPLKYQWQFNNGAIVGATNSFLALTNITLNQAGAYRVAITNAAGGITSQAATISVSNSLRMVRVVSTAAAAAAAVEVPVELVGFGDESSVGFSLNFDPAVLSFTSASLGSGAPGAGLLLNTNGLNSGRLGVVLARQAGQTFARGTNQLLRLRFLAGNISESAALSFGDDPVACEVADLLANPRPAGFRDGLLSILATAPSITQPPTNLVAPIFSTAVLRAEVAGSVPLACQWQRDGIEVPGATDAVLILSRVTPAQAGDYRLVVTNAVGVAVSDAATLQVPRVVRAGATNGPTGNLIEVPIELLSAGDENSLGFSLAFDPARLTAVGASPGNGLALNINTNAPGQIGVALARPGNAPFGFGTQQVASIQFLLGQQAGTNDYLWIDAPVARDLADTNASSLAVQFAPGFINIQLVAPQITRQPAAPPAWAGDTVTLEVAASGSKPMTWQWQKNGADIPGATNAALTLANISNTDEGNYNVRVSNAAGVASSFNTLLTVRTPLPDLYVNSASAPAQAGPGQTVPVTWKLFNNGNAGAPAGWWHTLWLAADAAGNNPQFISALQFTNPLPAGQSLSITGRITVPPDLLGDRYFMVRADGSNDVAELSENNNLAIAPQSTRIAGGDLVLASISAPAEAQVGETITVSWVVTNNADTPVTGPWQDRIYLATAPESLAGAFLLSTAPAPSPTLPPGASYANARQVILPGNQRITPGAFYLTVLADALNQTIEFTRTNNSRSTPIQLVADYVVTASNHPPAGGTVTGAGYYLAGATCALTAYPAPGYKFVNWTQNGTVISTNLALTNIVSGDALFVANYAEANLTHTVTAATSPDGLATVTGAGVYTNGQLAVISAPLAITNAPYLYTFRQFQINGAPVSGGASFTRTFSTLDPPEMNFVAVYDRVTLLPLIIQTTANYPAVAPATTNYVLSLLFNRSMDTNFTPLVALTNPAAVLQATVPAGGTWSKTASGNDTFTLPPITFATGMDGDHAAWVSSARDLSGNELALTNVRTIAVDVTPPANPALTLSDSNSTSASVTWAAYAAPADLSGFRVYLGASDFSSVAGLTPLYSLGAGSRGYTYTGLTLDQPYHAAVVAVDQAGNSSTSVTPLAFTLTSSLPPPVAVQVTAAGPASAVISWSGYNTSPLLGFAGFQLFYESSNFTSVAGLSPKQTLGTGARAARIDALERTKDWYFAVVGYNGKNEFNPNVTPGKWTDPYSGMVAEDLTLGGSGQEIVDILQTLTIVNNAAVTIRPGTTLRFAPGTGLIVRQGRLNAQGTALDPIVLTSATDRAGQTPAAGDWNGVLLETGGGGSVLRHVFISYGAGLTISNCAPVVDAFTALHNTAAGLTVAAGAALNTTNALLAFNDTGARQLDSGQLSIVHSSIKNNGTNALSFNGASLRATQNWWGTASGDAITASLRGAVDASGYLSDEPLLTPALGIQGNLTQTGTQTVNLRLACRTADAMRVSEDSTFNGVFFSPFTNQSAFLLSAGGGQKTIFAQFRGLTGQLSDPVPFVLTYITAGPAISSFTLSEGAVLARPVQVSAAASAPLGMAAMEFYVDGLGGATNTGGVFSYRFDIRNLGSGIHRVELLARDNAGNFATRAHNVVIAPTPPPIPVIATPAVDLVINTNNLSIGGSAEPFVEVRLFRSAALVGATTAAADGSFHFSGVALHEGLNQLSAMAIDSLGSASSLLRNVTLDTLPPAQLVMDAPSYTPGVGLKLAWRYPATGKQAPLFKVFWSTSPISEPDQALGNTLPLSVMNTTVRGLATANYYFYVVGYDSLGNAGPLSLPIQYAYDAVPPAFAVAFDKPAPVGVGPLRITLTASKPLNGIPTLTVQPAGNPPALLPLTNTALNLYEAVLNVTTFLPSGPIRLNISAVDLAGNPFNGAPTGPALALDVTPPAGAIVTAPLPPIQATNDTDVTVSLQLTEPPKPGTVPAITFAPPTGPALPVVLTGSGSNWLGTLTVTPGMGSGVGHFALTVSDSLDNIGHSLNTGGALEIYNTPLPTPPGQPVHFEAASLSGGRVRLTWDAVPNAEIYRVYGEPGTNYLIPPTALVADEVGSNAFVHLPDEDGNYRYTVTALRRGAEGAPSIVRVALSDRTPPPAPLQVAAQLAANGLQITWQPGAGEAPDHYNVYRNGALIRTSGTVTPVIDNPPRGVMTYTVAAADALGNEALGDPATFEALVGAVANLQALVNAGQAPVLSWVSSDATAVGFNIYRDGVKQNDSPLPGTSFTDLLPAPASGVRYSVRAVNHASQESAPRSVDLQRVALRTLANRAADASNNPLVMRYFDQFEITVSNLTTTGSLPLRQLELRRTVGGAEPLTISRTLNQNLPAGSRTVQSIVLPAAKVVAGQAVQLRAVQETDFSGSSAIYQQTFNFSDYASLGTMVQVTANDVPLAGGLASFDLEIFNRGYADMNLIVSRNNGADPGDIYLSVKGPQGQEVSRGEFNGAPAGTTFLPNGIGYLSVPPGGSRRVTVANVLVPDALATNTAVTFEGGVSHIYHQLGAASQIESGPLSGAMSSALAVTEYYGTAQTDKPGYANEEPVVITGQAIQRSTGQPLPNTNLKIGFATRGFQWYREVTTDDAGNYRYVFNPTPGLGGFFAIWAAHPLVFDVLNQAQIAVYRLYASPPRGDLRMSKNDSLGFSINLINPGDTPLTGFTSSFRAYTMSGTNQAPENRLHGTVSFPADFGLSARESRTVNLQVNADADAPDNAMIEFTLRSAEGAAAVFTGTTTLLPAVPVLTVVDPAAGYLETSLDRGAILSRSVTVMNRGLKDLKGVELIAPTNITWMLPNLPVDSDGRIRLPDLGVGQSNTFTVVFTPPEATPLDYYQDRIIIKGTNSPTEFAVNLYARVTSDQKGAVQFYVENILAQPVPNATVRLRSVPLQVELAPVTTDVNGLTTVGDLQEGEWSWMLTAPGHSSKVGTVNVIPNQTVQVAPPETRLSKSLVTVNFRVEPVPYTDRYEIKIEQTFETHVPVPVLVVDPPYKRFENVQPGFEANYIVTVKNEGLQEMTDVHLIAGEPGWGALTPLITYIPVLLPQQSVEVPFRATYFGDLPRGPGGQSPQFNGDDFADCATGGIKGLIDALAGIQAIANAQGRCISDQSMVYMAQGILAAYVLYNAAGLANPVTFIGNLLSCLGQQLFAGFGDGGGGGGGGGPAQNGVGKYGMGGPECFAAGTQVLLANGQHKAIELIQTNDIVRTGERTDALGVVTEVHSRLSDKVRAIRLESSEGAGTVVRATSEHLFWVDGKGWTPARDLTTADWLFNEAGQRVRVAANDGLKQALRVHTLRLRGDFAFYAGGVLVHDMCGVWPEQSSRVAMEANR